MAATMPVTEAAGVLGTSRTTAYEAVRDGSLRSIRVRRRIATPRAWVFDVLNGLRWPDSRQGKRARALTKRTNRRFHRKLPMCLLSLRFGINLDSLRSNGDLCWPGHTEFVLG
jgi:excisionase family DNA binding protein